MTQQEKNDAVCAPPRPLVLGERTLLLSPPTLSDTAGIAAEARRLLAGQTPLGSLVNDPAFKLLPAACQVEAVREAAKVQVSGDGQNLSGMSLVEELAKPELLGFAIWVLARKNHPGLTLEEIRPAITEDNSGALFVDFLEASGMLAMEKKTADGPSG